ncbi:hypothetical protein [Almyronema epifaneia]|uniref:Uncharacterized protein n=1 Tax=Almyronema epifaneia S1 TaxID=2991925 RepID=A0ABW6IHQ3_9CYAN
MRYPAILGRQGQCLGLGMMVAGLVLAAAAAEALPIDEANPNLTTAYEALLQLPLTLDPDEALLESGEAITENTISMTSLTPPSLWWQQEQTSTSLGAPQLLNTWVAFRGSPQQPRRIDLVVNAQIWEALSYLEHYVLVNQFGTSAKSFGYNLRVFAGRNLVGANVCDFSAYSDLETLNHNQWPDTDLIATVPCTIVLDYLGRSNVRGR